MNVNEPNETLKFTVFSFFGVTVAGVENSMAFIGGEPSVYDFINALAAL